MKSKTGNNKRISNGVYLNNSPYNEKAMKQLANNKSSLVLYLDLKNRNKDNIINAACIILPAVSSFK